VRLTSTKFAEAASATHHRSPDTVYHVTIGRLPYFLHYLGFNLVAENEEHGVSKAGNQLRDFIDKDEVTCSETKKMRKPLVILAFDEAHVLTEFVHNRNWSIYSELRRCLVHIVDLPIFTLFLSTAGKFRHFSPEKKWEISSRVAQGRKWVLPPITETGFDQFALPAKEGETTLDAVVQDQWICCLGRPLYAFPTSAF